MDAWDNDFRKDQVAINELLPGELSAITFTVGCYTVRSAFRVYQSSRENRNFIPADKETLDFVRKFEDKVIRIFDGKLMPEYRNFKLIEWGEELHISLYHEISAKHNTDPNGAFANGFINICNADMRGRDQIR